MDANDKIGWGHFYRCIALAELLRDYFKVSFAISNPSRFALNILNEKAITVIKLPKVEYFLLDADHNFEIKFDLHDHANIFDVVVIDGYWFGIKFQNSLRNYVCKTVLIDDYGKDCNVDLVINSAFGITTNAFPCDTVCALGPSYALLRKEFLEKARQTTLFKNNIDTVFISFGGSDPYNLTFDTVSWFLRNTSVSITVVIGPSYAFSKSLNEIAQAYDRITVKSNLCEREMIKAMTKADLGVVPASSLLLEAIACRLPVISSAYVDNQKNMFDGCKEMGVLIETRSFQDYSDAWKIALCIDLQIIQKRQIQLIDGYSDKRLVDKFTNLYQN